MNPDNEKPQGADTPAVSSEKNKGGSGLPSSFADLTEKRGRGVQPGSKRGPYRKGGSETVKREELPTAFTPEVCKHLVELPFNLAFVKTGYEGFSLTEPESKTLGAGAATVLNTWVTIDPKWAALMMFSVSLVSITAAKLVGYREVLLKKKQEEGGGNA